MRTVFCFSPSALTIQEANGKIQAGVGIRLQHELRYGIYVAGLTPKSPAENSGQIEEDDVLLCIDGCVLSF